MKTERLPEIIQVIELIDDDSDAFGDRQRTGTSNDTGGPRWIGPVAAAALAGLIGYGVITSASTNGAPKTASITTTTVASTPTTRPDPASSVVPAVADAYYAADPPPEFTVQYANVQPLDHAPFQGYGYELWATPDASASSGDGSRS